jgi:hypothetical protein
VKAPRERAKQDRPDAQRRQERTHAVARAVLPGRAAQTPDDVLRLQGCAGNAAVSLVLSTPAVVQRGDPPAGPSPREKVEQSLREVGTQLSDDDLDKLARQFPRGDIDFAPVQVNLYGRTGSSAAAVKMSATLVTAKTHSPGTATYIFGTGSGRGILVVGMDGASTLFDAGAGAGTVASGLIFLVAAGLAKTPGTIKISHTDSDHLTDLSQVVESSELPKPVVEITKQQLQDPGLTKFARSQLSAVGPMIEIDVIGEGTHVRRQYSGALQYTDLRWAPAHQALAAGGVSAKQRASLTNQGSPVTIVRDLMTGETRMYTADSEPSTVMRMFDYIHPSAMPYILGSGQLKEFEIPHHGGANTEGNKTEAALNYVRMLRLAYEASDGTSTFFTQMEGPHKLEQETNHVRALHAAGFPIETVFYEPGKDGGPGPVRKIQGGLASTLTLDGNEIAEVKSKVQPQESALMETRRVGAAVARLRAMARIQMEAVGEGSPTVARSINEMLDKLNAEDAARAAAVETWWTALESALRASNGFNARLDVTSAKAAIDKLRETPILTAEGLAGYERTVEFNRSMMDSVGRASEVALGMSEALLSRDAKRMTELKVLQGESYRAAVATLGSAQVEETLLETWKGEAAKLQTMQGQLLEMGYEAAKAKAENRMTAASVKALTNQMRLQQTVNNASEGNAGIPRDPSGNVRPVARAGAGLMAAMEVVRLTLDVWKGIQASLAAERVRAINRTIRGYKRMDWWIGLGATPSVQLVGDDDRPLSPSVEGVDLVFKALAKESLPDYNIPENPRVVITALSQEAQMMAANHLFLNATNLNDWHRLLNDARGSQDEQGRPQIEVDDKGKWAVYIWDFTRNDYVQQANDEVSRYLDKIYQTCSDNSTAELNQKIAKSGGGVGSVKETGIWRWKGRDVWVYSRNALRKTSFPFAPTLLLPKSPPSSGRVGASAADASTYDFLRQFQWTGQSTSAVGGPADPSFIPNEDARCFIDVSDFELATKPTGSPAAAGR